MSQLTELDGFIALSEILTGETGLDKTLADQYLQRLKGQYPAQMQSLLKTFGENATDPSAGQYAVFEVKRRIIGDKNLQPVAQQIIAIWYTSEFVGADGKPKGGTQAQFYSGLLWKVIQAHAPTDSQGPYGYWTRRPSSH